MRDIGRTYWHIMKTADRRIGMPRAQAHVLGHVAAAGEIGQTDLQRRLGVDGAAITRQVKQLEAAGLVSRRPDPADNRVTLVALTPYGRERMAAVAARAAAFVRDCMAGIPSEDIAAAARVLTRMRQNVVRMDGPSDPAWPPCHAEEDDAGA